MENFEFLEELNNQLQSFCEKENKKRVDFRAGKVDETLLSILKDKAPFSKVALLFTEKSAKNLLPKYQSLLKKEGYKVHSVILKEKALYSIENLLDVCFLPEDARAIITFDNSLLTPLKYSSSVNNLPSIFVSVKNQTEKLLDVCDYIKNGAFAHEFNFDCEFTTIFNSELELTEDLNDVLFRYECILDVIDYEIATAIYDYKPSESSNLFLSRTVSKDGKNFFAHTVKYYASNFLNFGEIRNKSAFNSIVQAYVLANGKDLLLKDKARIIKALFLIYKFGISQSQSETLKVTNYLGIITKACKRLKLDVFNKSEKFLKALDEMAKNSSNVEKRLEKFEKIFNLEDLFDDFDEVFGLENVKSKKHLIPYVMDGVCLSPCNVLGFLTSKGVVHKILGE